MVSHRSDDQTEEVTYPILSEVEERFKSDNLSALCYPIGLAAYFADQLLYYGAFPIEIIEELRQGSVRKGKDQSLVSFPQTLEVAVDSLIGNDFYMLLAIEIKESHIYDADTFFDFMQDNSPEAIQLGVTGKHPRGRFKIVRQILPREIRL
jgi:hypothetical protein